MPVLRAGTASPYPIRLVGASRRYSRSGTRFQQGAGELETAAHWEIVLALVCALEPIVKRVSELTIEIRHAVDEHADGATFRSLFIAADSWLCADLTATQRWLRTAVTEGFPQGQSAQRLTASRPALLRHPTVDTGGLIAAA